MSAIDTRYGDPDELTQEDAERSHPGFTVTCQQCGSALVYIETDLGFSSTSGSWGGVSLTCFACKATAPLLGD
jgi:hypothetical protein